MNPRAAALTSGALALVCFWLTLGFAIANAVNDSDTPTFARLALVSFVGMLAFLALAFAADRMDNHHDGPVS